MVATGMVARADDRSGIRILAAAGAIFGGLTALYYFSTINWSQPFARDATTLVVGRDFLNFWMYGRAAWTPDPSRFYDPQLYKDALTALLGPDYPGQNWSYPPSIMLIAAPFGRLPYAAALVCWTVLGVAVFVCSALHNVGGRMLLVAALLSPAAVFCLISGQSALITTAMLLAIFTALDRRPLLAGVLIGTLTLKPQLGLLLPVMLAASGRWRVFLTAAATALLIAGATTVLVGPQVWSDFILKGLPVQNLVLADPERIATPFYPTIFMNLRGAGASYGLAMAVQACGTAFAIAAVFFAYRFRGNADRAMLNGLFFACAICAVPYLLSYDTLALSCCAVILLGKGALDARGQILAKLAYWLPLLQMIFGTFHIPGPALIAPAFAAYLLMRLAPAAASASANGRIARES